MNALLERQQELQTRQEKVQAQLDDRTNEFILLVRLTAINYSLGEQRISKTIEYFENALKSGRTAYRLFAYAHFLRKNNQFNTAEKLSTEALDIRRKLAQANPQVYLPDLAGTLGGFGYAYILWEEPDKARLYLAEAANIIDHFAQQHPDVYGGLQKFITNLLAKISSQ